MTNDSSSKVGEIEWNEIPEGGPGSGKSHKVPYLKMKDPAEYRVRVISKPFQYYCHWVDTPDGSRRKVNATMDGNDPIVLEEGKGPQCKWLVKVLYRNAETKKTELAILDAGQQIVSQIKKLHESPNFGNVSKYDIVITKGKPKSNPLYTVLPLLTDEGRRPLNDEEKRLYKESSDSQSDNFVDIEALIRPWTAEEILAVLEGKNGQKGEGTTDRGPTKEEKKSADLFGEEEFIDL